MSLDDILASVGPNGSPGKNLGVTRIVGLKVEKDMVEQTIETIFSQYLPAMNACYQKALKGDPNLRGETDLQVSVNVIGKVKSVSVSRNTIAAPQVVNCITNRIRGWQFPRQSKSGKIRVTLTFDPN